MDGDERRDEFVERTLEVWQPRCDRVLTREDARETILNAAGFFRLLLEWDLAEQARSGTGKSQELESVDVDDVA